MPRLLRYCLLAAVITTPAATNGAESTFQAGAATSVITGINVVSFIRFIPYFR